MRQAGRDALSLALIDARNHTLRLLAAHEAASRAPERARYPGGKRRSAPVAGRARRLVCRSPGSPATRRSPWAPAARQRRHVWPRSSPTPISGGDLRIAASAPGRGPAGPDFTATRGWLLETLETTLDLLDKAADSDDALYFYRLALFHEDQVGERLVVLAQTLGVPLALEAPLIAGLREPLGVPATRWQLGSTPGGFVFDNEKWAHDVAVPEFEIDAQPVSWSQFVEFVDDGGYDRQALWHPEGWAWLQDAEASGGRRGPRHVEQIGVARFGGAGAVLQMRFGQPVRLAGHHPATHVSWWEADAWCRWAGRRLPERSNGKSPRTSAARRGFRWGDVHEWTASRFQPYPGFTPDPWVDYSVPHFGKARVLRGASWATRSRLKHPKFRGFSDPGEDEIFCRLPVLRHLVGTGNS